MTRFIPGAIAMAIIVVASNILVQFHLGAWLTWGAITYPFAFLVTDVMNRVYGPAAARRVVLAGFAIGVVCSLVAAGMDKTTLRIAIASGAAFLIAQLLDISVFNAMRTSGGWWKAPLVSSFFGSAVDTALFFSIAFAAQFSFIDPADNVGWANEMIPLLGFGPAAPVWASLATADWLMKMLLALLALVPFRLMVRNILRRNAAF
ncbi:queuosine precursor transporter [Paracoccus albus]|uniref:queuosine precursor transporter n=1 Tax=Paracoccus albus TaxID=3017784 RepID=UPI0022F04D27|nr:queuosine precursor transporter [Paracoccus albus]WBU60157.1 queuosine precursor transporter [Paracoccus albus]